MRSHPAPLRVLLASATLVALGACGGESITGPDDDGVDFVSDVRVVVDPNGTAPLTARVSFTTTRPVSVAVTVPGRGGAETDVGHRFPDVSQAWTVPVLGLYPGSVNDVVLTFFDAGGVELGRTTVPVTTSTLSAGFPSVRVDVAAGAGVKPGLNLVSYFGHAGSVTPQRAFMFDRAGAIRWVFDPSANPALANLFYDDGIEVLANGNLYFGDRSMNRIYEVDRLGGVVRSWGMPGYTFHHDVIEKPNGNFVATVNKIGAPTVEDHVIEIDRATGAVVTEWDLRRSLQVDRRAWPTDLADLDVDWFHANAVVYDEADDTIVVSGRTQGVVKLTASNEVVWVLAPHKGWGAAGDGTDLSERLLQPLDAAGRPITDAAVLRGDVPHPDFEWSWYQHAPLVLPDGTLMLFDNGDNRHYTGQPVYSRAVAYRIDPAARTVQQVWQYGKERGGETYSRIVSDVDYHERERTVVFMPGAVGFGGAQYGKVVEVDYDSRRVLFEATVTAPQTAFGITFHRVERVPLYPPDAAAPPA